MKLKCLASLLASTTILSQATLCQTSVRSEDNVKCELSINCRNNQKEIDMPIRLPIRGAPGPPGYPGPKGERGDSGGIITVERGYAMEPGEGMPDPQALTCCQSEKVAFYVGLMHNIGPVSINTDVVWDTVVTNVGQAYSEQTGRFTAPVEGTYAFNVVISPIGRKKAAVYLSHNGKMVLTIWAENIPAWSSASNTAILNLNRVVPPLRAARVSNHKQQGDNVWVVLLSRASHLHGYMYSTFTGNILFGVETPTVNEPVVKEQSSYMIKQPVKGQTDKTQTEPQVVVKDAEPPNNGNRVSSLSNNLHIYLPSLFLLIQ